MRWHDWAVVGGALRLKQLLLRQYLVEVQLHAVLRVYLARGVEVLHPLEVVASALRHLGEALQAAAHLEHEIPFLPERAAPEGFT